jgi:hypothetical protein
MRLKASYDYGRMTYDALWSLAYDLVMDLRFEQYQSIRERELKLSHLEKCLRELQDRQIQLGLF